MNIHRKFTERSTLRVFRGKLVCVGSSPVAEQTTERWKIWKSLLPSETGHHQRDRKRQGLVHRAIAQDHQPDRSAKSEDPGPGRGARPVRRLLLRRQRGTSATTRRRIATQRSIPAARGGRNRRGGCPVRGRQASPERNAPRRETLAPPGRSRTTGTQTRTGTNDPRSRTGTTAVTATVRGVDSQRGSRRVRSRFSLACDRARAGVAGRGCRVHARALSLCVGHSRPRGCPGAGRPGARAGSRTDCFRAHANGLLRAHAMVCWTRFSRLTGRRCGFVARRGSTAGVRGSTLRGDARVAALG